MDNESILYSALSCLATLCLLGLATTKVRAVWIAGVAFLLSVVAFPISTALAVQMGGTCLLMLGAIATRSHERRQRYLPVVIPCVVPFVIFGLPLLDREYYEVMAIKRAYPIVSLGEKLKYEDPTAAPELTKSERAEISEQTWRQVARTSWSIRTRNLALAHHLTQSHFAKAVGFGRGRVPMVYKESIDLPDFGPIPYDAAPPSIQPAYHANGSVADSSGPIRPMQPLFRGDLSRMHRQGVDDFLEFGRMGYVQDLQHVAGFTSHRFMQLPGTERPERGHWYRQFDKSELQAPARESWRSAWAIVRLELISILGHEEPVAYISEHLPQLDELSRYRVRELTAFEGSALNQLQANEDVVIEDQPQRVLMVGALRATDQCRQCHHVKRGDLLGALSYELRPER